MGASAHAAIGLDKVSGLIERVTYFNEEIGFAVLRVKASGHRDLVTVIGSLPSASAGEWLTAEGTWIRDREHGLQLKASVIRTVPPSTRGDREIPGQRHGEGDRSRLRQADGGDIRAFCP